MTRLLIGLVTLVVGTALLARPADAAEPPSFKGKTVKVPIKDKCPGCSADKVDLSQNAFKQLADLGVGIINGASWSIGSC